MRALRTSLTAPTKATNTPPSSRYFSTMLSFLPAAAQGNRISNHKNSRLRSRWFGSRLPVLSCERSRTGARTKRNRCLSPRLRDVTAEDGADANKGIVDIGCQSLHCHYSGEGNQSQDQCVFHQALTCFVSVQPVQRLQNQIGHFLLPRVSYELFPAPGEARKGLLQSCTCSSHLLFVRARELKGSHRSPDTRNLLFPRDYGTYELRIVPMPTKELLMSFARVCIATKAAQATRARINAYSTRP